MTDVPVSGLVLPIILDSDVPTHLVPSRLNELGVPWGAVLVEIGMMYLQSHLIQPSSSGSAVCRVLSSHCSQPQLWQTAGVT